MKSTACKVRRPPSPRSGVPFARGPMPNFVGLATPAGASATRGCRASEQGKRTRAVTVSSWAPARYCTGHANHGSGQARSDGDPHLHRSRRSRGGRGVGVHPARARQPPRPRLARGDPHPGVCGQGAQGRGGPDLAGDRAVRDARRRPRSTAAAGSARWWRVAGWSWPSPRPRRSASPRSPLPNGARGAPRRLRRDGGERRACGDALGERRVRPERRAVGRRGPAPRHQSPRDRRSGGAAARDGARLRDQRGGGGQDPRQAEPRSSVRPTAGSWTAEGRPSPIPTCSTASRPAPSSPPATTRATAWPSPWRSSAASSPAPVPPAPGTGDLRERHADDLPRRGALPGAAPSSTARSARCSSG